MVHFWQQNLEGLVGFWLPCSPSTGRLCVCVRQGLSSSRAVPSLQPGRDFCLAALLSLSLHAGSGVCRSSLLHSSSGELSAFSPLCHTAPQRSTWTCAAQSSATLRLVGFSFFPSLVVFFLYFLPRELFSRGEQPVSYSAAGCKLPKAYKIKLVLVINPLVHYLLFAIFHVYKLFSWFFFINLIFNQSVTGIHLPSQLVYNDNFLQDTFFIHEYHRYTFSPTKKNVKTDILILLHT